MTLDDRASALAQNTQPVQLLRSVYLPWPDEAWEQGAGRGSAGGQARVECSQRFIVCLQKEALGWSMLSWAVPHGLADGIQGRHIEAERARERTLSQTVFVLEDDTDILRLVSFTWRRRVIRCGPIRRWARLWQMRNGSHRHCFYWTSWFPVGMGWICAAD